MNANVIVGICGHIDHGKTSFIKAINNYDGDSRSDERERGITIDISFSNIVLGDKNISFIDTPGHEKLVKNMVKAAFGIDVLIVIIALNEGIMPQTMEHINIAKLLGIKKAIVFLSKCDILNDENRISILKTEINKLFSKLEMELLSINKFSIYDLESIENAKKILFALEGNKKSGLFFRFYCDRVFIKKGYGVVVTGTSLGEISKGSKILICDNNKEATIKNMHTHNLEIENSFFNQRLALNLSIDIDSIESGFLLSSKGILRGFDRIDCVIYPLSKIKNLQNLNFFIGTKKIQTQIIILEESSSKIFATLKFPCKVFSVFKERFILRDEITIGGGMVLNPISDSINKNLKITLLHYLLEDDFLNSFNLLIRIYKFGFGLIQSLQRFNLSRENALEIAKKIENVFIDENALVIYDLSSKKIIADFVLNLISKNKNAIFSASSISNSLSWASIKFCEFVLEELEKENKIKMKENLYVGISNEILNLFDYVRNRILNNLSSSGITPLSPYNIYENLGIERSLGDKALKSLTHAKKVVRLSHNVFILSNALNKLMQELRFLISKEGYIDIYRFKENYNISRKYIICYLDYLDKFGDIININGKRFFKGKHE